MSPPFCSVASPSISSKLLLLPTTSSLHPLNSLLGAFIPNSSLRSSHIFSSKITNFNLRQAQFSSTKFRLPVICRAAKKSENDKAAKPETKKSEEKEENAVAKLELEELEEEEEGGELQEVDEEVLSEQLNAAWDKIISTVDVPWIPGPRMGGEKRGMPWVLAALFGYLSLTFLIAVVKTVRKASAPKAKRKRQISANAVLCRSLDSFFPSKREAFNAMELKKITNKFKFSELEVLRKYVRYALNERVFNADLVADIIALRKATSLSDDEVAELLNDVARRLVKAKGIVVMNTEGFTERGLKRKAAVQALFSKLLYLSEVEEMCSSSVRDKLQIKVIFGVTDEDADSIRIVSLSSAEDLDILERSMERDGGGEGESGGEEEREEK